METKFRRQQMCGTEQRKTGHRYKDGPCGKTENEKHLTIQEN
jgi:hypothetical protein